MLISKKTSVTLYFVLTTGKPLKKDFLSIKKYIKFYTTLYRFIFHLPKKEPERTQNIGFGLRTNF